MKISLRFIIYIIIANILILLSNLPLFIRIQRTPPGFTFPLTHSDSYHDYALYLSAITQGKNGSLLFRDPYTTETSKPGIFYIYYTGVGKIASIFHFSSPLAYHLGRIISVEIFILLVYILSRQLLGGRIAFWGALISLLGTIPPLSLFKDIIIFPSQIPWWLYFDAVERLNQIPHNVFGQDMLLLTTIFFVSFLRTQKIRFASFAAAAAFAAGIIFPPVLSTIGLALPLSYLIYLSKQKFSLARAALARLTTYKLRKPCIDKKIFFGIILITLSAFLSLYLIRWQETQGFPWNIWTSWNVTRWNVYEPNFNYSFLLLFGFLAILALPAVFDILKKSDLKQILLVGWVTIPYILIPFANLINIPKLRIAQTALFVPFGLLITQTIFSLHIAPGKRLWQFILLAFFLAATLPVSFFILSKRVDFVLHESSFPGYLSPNVIASLEFIQDNIPKDSIFVSYEYMGNFIPALSPVVSFVGHMNLTRDFSNKRITVIDFLREKQTPEKARDFVIKNRIQYVFFGPDEKKFGLEKLSYDFLKVIYENNEVIVYKVTA